MKNIHILGGLAKHCPSSYHSLVKTPEYLALGKVWNLHGPTLACHQRQILLSHMSNESSMDWDQQSNASKVTQAKTLVAASIAKITTNIKISICDKDNLYFFGKKILYTRTQFFFTTFNLFLCGIFFYFDLTETELTKLQQFLVPYI